MQYRRMLAVTATLGIAFAVSVALSSPVQAAEAEPICATWEARGGSMVEGDFVFGGQPVGTEIDKLTAKLTKPEGEKPGVEFAVRGLNLTVEQDTEVRVQYQLKDGASWSAGAVRMFGYTDNSASTLTDPPTWQADAKGESGELKFQADGEAKTINILGLVFDGSNDSKGSVTFSQMFVGDRPVYFEACPKPVPTDTKTTEPKDCEAYTFVGTEENLCKAFDGAATATEATCTQVKYRVKLNDPKVDPWGLDGSGDNVGAVGIGCESNPLKPTDEPTTTPVGNEMPPKGPTLPVTGPGGLGLVFIVGTGLLLVGAIAIALSRRRKPDFTA